MEVGERLSDVALRFRKGVPFSQAAAAKSKRAVTAGFGAWLNWGEDFGGNVRLPAVGILKQFTDHSFLPEVLIMGREILEKIVAERPGLHSGETETRSVIAAEDTIFHGSALEHVNKDLPAFYAIRLDVANFIYDSVSKESLTLETGAGLSTLVFALRGTKHIAVTPNAKEVIQIREYAGENRISLERVEFVIRSSDEYLPQCTSRNLDFVLIDGKHAFPWPILDWFYLADRLKLGGILLLDDLELAPVAILRDFLSEDRHWEAVRSFRGHTMAFRKITEPIHDVAWHMQPYVTNRYVPPSRILQMAKHVARKSGIPRIFGIR